MVLLRELLRTKETEKGVATADEISIVVFACRREDR